MPEITYIEAIRQALWEEMERDERVFLIGEDIGVYGGAFKITMGFLEKFGEDRVIDTPIAESAIVGSAVGAALMGLRPVVEMQFSDFIACGFDQIVNMAAKFHYRTGTSVPLVIRGPSGGGVHGGPFHSQNPEGWFVHVPGLKVLAPSTPYDAKGLLKAAIRDPDPVIYFEHKYLYRRIKGKVPDDDFTVPIGKAEVKREGADLSVITYGAMIHQAFEAANRLSAKGIEVEILDLRTLLPLDREAILATARKTGKVVVVHEATRTGGVGGEVVAVIAEGAFDRLDGPILRVTAPDTPVPFTAPLEEAFLPNADTIVAAAERLAAY
ncbi:MAG: pyruvate dehydrogenase [candidate division NC10 bacterium RIFCSPLOWO2_12_FULL_66_18]|nr:MAG: pyruvate dehydrogenase [candidate division NC10 bacterium RIFCSPLOWO2_02_FULL_66_22]OGC02510.1 MAG: pyruvate dehydrogenase [candidate division NC10 bacterium RIFCSPLOWO2_12_FULL_66_18]